MCKVVTIGEPMALFVAEQEVSLEDVETFSRYVAGAEVNFSIGMSRLGHDVSYITRLGKEPFSKYIEKFLKENDIDTTYVSYDEKYITGMQWKQKVVSGSRKVFSSRKNSAASHITPIVRYHVMNET